MTDAQSFQQYALSRRPHIEKHLRSVLKLKQLQTTDLGQEYQTVLRELTTLIRRGGKRVRPLLYLMTYEGYGGKRTAAALEVALSLELLHTFLLIHDDVIDRDYMRWGGPNIAGVYFERYSRDNDARDALHAAEAYAILAGDICLSWAQDRLIASAFEPAIITELQQLQQRLLQAVISGELTEIASSHQPEMLTETDVLQIYAEKTSSYSFTLPLLSAAASAGASADAQVLETLGISMGIAYQLQDDLNSVFADESTTGKPIAGDLRESRRTVLLLKTLELLPSVKRQEVEKLLTHDTMSDQTIELLRAHITDSGARDYVEAAIQRHCAEAATAIDQTTLHASAKQRLHDLVRGISGR